MTDLTIWLPLSGLVCILGGTAIQLLGGAYMPRQKLIPLAGTFAMLVGILLFVLGL